MRLNIFVSVFCFCIIVISFDVRAGGMNVGSLSVESCYCAPTNSRGYCMGEKCSPGDRGDEKSKADYQGKMSIPQCAAACSRPSGDGNMPSFSRSQVKKMQGVKVLRSPQSSFSRFIR